MNQSNEIADLAKALAAAQASLTAAKKDATNPHFRSHYATLQSVWDSAREVLAPNGLSVVQTFQSTDGAKLDLTTTLLHESGQWITGTLSMIPQQSTPQGIGSAITYARRYALAAILGIVADEDDDGNAGSNKTDTQLTRPAARPAPVTPAARTNLSPKAAPRPVNTFEVGRADWRSVLVPKFITKYAGRTLGDMDQNDLLWWAEHYTPKPFKGAISEADIAFRKSLDAARDELDRTEVATAGNADGEDVPF